MEKITTQSSDVELMDEFESLRRQACGEAIGLESQGPREAANYEGWTVVRSIHGGTNLPGTPILARDGMGNLWVVNDLDGPWAIQVAESK